MADAQAWLSKAEEALAGAGAEATERRYDNAANRLYFACFQAAIAALVHAGVRPERSEWKHSDVQAEFNGILVKRRHLYPSDFRGLLNELGGLREKADYESQRVSGGSIRALLGRGRALVGRVGEVIEGGRK